MGCVGVRWARGVGRWGGRSAGVVGGGGQRGWSAAVVGGGGGDRSLLKKCCKEKRVTGCVRLGGVVLHDDGRTRCSAAAWAAARKQSVPPATEYLHPVVRMLPSLLSEGKVKCQL